MVQTYGDREATRLERAVRTFVARVETVPDGLLREPPTPGEWSVGELAAHSAEIYGYWAEQIDFLRSHPGQPFGRTMDDPQRIAFVALHKDDPVGGLLTAIKTSSARAARALRAYTDPEWASVTGVHSARGVMDMDAISNLFLAGHAEDHLGQLDQTLAALERSSGD